MKIGFFGNTNNVPLIIARAMQHIGHEVILVVNRTELLCRPESRFPEYMEGYPEWILDSSQYSELDYISLDPKIVPVLEALSGCDALFLNDLGPSLLPLLQRPAISFLTGSDLTYYGDYQTIDVFSGPWSEVYKKTYEAKLWERMFVDFVQRQRDGIRLSVAVRYFPPGAEPRGEALLAEMGVLESKRIFQTTTDVIGIIPTPQPYNERVRVYCPVRITWKLPVEPGHSILDYKGSDIMVRGLGLFYRRTGIKLNIVLMRKGLHIAELEQIIIDENITDQVTWLDEMSITEYRKEIALSDIILEQFGASIVGSVGFDAMASARPVIGNMRPELFGDSMPICQAKTPEEICAQLEHLVNNPQERERVGRAGREYVEKHVNVDEFARKCLMLWDASIAQSSGVSSSLDTGYSYQLQQQHSLIEYVNPIQYILRQTSAREAELVKAASAREAELVKAASAREAELLNYLKSYALFGEKALRRIQLKEPYQQETGLCWAVQLVDFLPIADNDEYPNRSTILLFEDGKLLQPAHAIHEDIRNMGGGCYSHWGEVLYFSTSDGSDPNTNGREYRIIYID